MPIPRTTTIDFIINDKDPYTIDEDDFYNNHQYSFDDTDLFDDEGYLYVMNHDADDNGFVPASDDEF